MVTSAMSFLLNNNRPPISLLIMIIPTLMALVGFGVNDIEAGPKGPTFDCGKAVAKIEEMICRGSC